MFLKGVSDRNTTLPKTLNFWHCCVSIIKTVKKIGSIASHKLPYTNYELVKFPYKKGRGQQQGSCALLSRLTRKLRFG